jgi:excinuclease ABC subunit C
MVVFEDGLARKSEYRHFQIRGPQGAGAADDTEAIHEVIARRFARWQATGEPSTDPTFDPMDDAVPHPVEGAASSMAGASVALGGEVDADPRPHGRAAKFAYPPNLVVVDGGPPQVAAAQRALNSLGVTEVGLVGLAKRLEEVWLPDEPFPLILPRSSEGLYLLQRLRDEAHRFAISYHRKKRSAGMTGSALDGVPGLGPAKRKAILTHFGSVKRVREATADQLIEVEGVGPKLAAAIQAALTKNAEASRP